MFNKKTKDPLVESVKRVLSDSDGNRKIEAELNEELGIYNRNELPFEFRANYDATLKQRINENNKPDKPAAPKQIDAVLTSGKKIAEAKEKKWISNPSRLQRVIGAVKATKHTLPFAAATGSMTALTAKLGGLPGPVAGAAGLAAGVVMPAADAIYAYRDYKHGMYKENLDAIKDEIRTKILETLETLHSKGLKEEFDKYYTSLTPDQLDLIEELESIAENEETKWDNSTRDTSSTIKQQPPPGPPMVVPKNNMLMPNPVQTQNQSGTIKRPIAPPMVAPTAGEQNPNPAEALRNMFRNSGDDEQVTKKSALSESTKPVKMSLESALRHYGPGNIPNDKKIQESFESFLRKKLPE